MTITKSEIINSIQEQLNLSKNQSTEIFDTMIGTIKQSLESGEDVKISGFGKFCVKEKGKRKGRNPSTGEDLMLEPRRVVTFNWSGQLKEKLNK